MATKTAKKRINVLIADDQTLFREGIKDLLGGEKLINVCGEAVDGNEAVRLAKKLKPDVILMDIKLPALDGISATRQIREQLPQVNILILSSYEDEAHVLEAIQAGANGYLSKMLPASELIMALKTFATDGIMIPQNVMGKLLEGLRSKGSSSEATLTALTKTEIMMPSKRGRSLDLEIRLARILL